MTKYFLIIVILLFSHLAFAEDAIPVELEKAPVDINNIKSIQRGAKFFSTNCMVCHA